MSVMAPLSTVLTPWGGPTVLIEIGDVRLLVDPTFDAAGEYPIGSRTLTKVTDALITTAEIGRVDAVLLSHDQHPDNLDHGGRDFVRTAPLVLTTTAAADRLDAPCHGLQPWESVAVADITVTAVPAQHGPDGTESITGPVIGFVLQSDASPTLYVAGDNASLSVVQSIADRFRQIDVAVLFAGAARTPLLDAFLTLTSEQAVAAARILGKPRILPVHTDGWAHFTQNGETLQAAFESAGLADLLLPAIPGHPVRL